MITIFTFFILGLVLQRLLPRYNLSRFLNVAIIYFSLPALILYKIPTIHITKEALTPIIMPWVLTIFLSIFILYISKIYHFKKEEIGSLLLVSVLGNTSFLGVPLIQFFYGIKYVPYALLYDQLGSFLILSTYGSVVVAVYSNNSTINITSIIKKIVKFPPFITLVVSFFLLGTTYPKPLELLLNYSSSTLVPFVLLSVGYQLHFKVPKDERKPLFWAIFIKTVISPIVAFLLCYMFVDFNTITKVTILEAGMGPMITASIMAILANFKPRLTSAIVGYGILVSFITLPIFYKLLQYF